jgi:magnesium chelatase family protein
MLAKLKTFALVGIDAILVEVEVDVAAGLPKTILVGLPEAAVKESTHRIERALANLGYQRPTGRCVINLAPADLKKDAGSFDLPIAIGMLIGTGQLAPDDLDKSAIVGELALDGNTRPIKGALAMALACRQLGVKRLLVPTPNAREASVVEEIQVYGVDSLAHAVAFLSGQLDLEPMPSGIGDLVADFNRYEVDFADVRGQDYAKRALTIAAAGGHNVLLSGPPGSGKTMLARRLSTILPPLTPAESLETTRIYSVMGLLQPGKALLTERPYRSPHHTVSNAGLVGGGSTPTPGEISLAHHGVLFLDELPEFTRTTLEVLRQPLEEGRVTISRALRASTFPAHFILVAAMNPCPCGFLGDPRRPCKCAPPAIDRYMGKISGPLLDRIDLHVEVPAVPFADLNAPAVRNGGGSPAMREGVQQARRIQQQRFGRDSLRLNGRMSSRQIRQHCQLNSECQEILKTAVESLGLSARAHDRILRVARTIGDLEEAQTIAPQHVTEALNYRILDRKLWLK